MDGEVSTAAERAVLLHGPGVDLESVRTALEAEGVLATPLSDPDGGARQAGPGRPTVVVLASAPEPDLVDRLPPGTVVVALGEEVGESLGDRAFLTLPAAPDPQAFLQGLRAAFRHAAALLAATRVERELERSRGELQEVNQIGMALMTERDPARLLDKILSRSMSLTDSDAGSLYLVEQDREGNRRLRFRLSKTRSLPDLPEVEFTLPLDTTSVAGYVAVKKEPLVLEDAYDLPEDAPYTFNRSFDEEYGYRARSMLVVPMADHRDEVVGVLQLINRKRDPSAVITGEASASEHVIPYGDHELSLVRGLAGQAAVSIENARLYEQIEDIFESFVKAAVAAIDQRDPTTAGHSVRVAELTTTVAGLLPRVRTGRWAGARLSRDQMKELRYAALLHDFGKVGVREEVLIKAKKLPPYLWERVDARFDVIHRTLEKEHLQKKLELVEREGPDSEAIDRLEAELAERLDRLAEYREAVRRANEPSVLPEDAETILEIVANQSFEDVQGRSTRYIESNELEYLTIPKGSLDEAERREIESHVTQTYRFLQKIPWTDDLREVAVIAYAHHEKLDGRGYPRGVTGEQIPIQARIMTIADIFDALTASDRPYKRALSADRALDILKMEADEGMLDTELVELVVQSRAYERILETDWREL